MYACIWHVLGSSIQAQLRLHILSQGMYITLMPDTKQIPKALFQKQWRLVHFLVLATTTMPADEAHGATSKWPVSSF